MTKLKKINPPSKKPSATKAKVKVGEKVKEFSLPSTGKGTVSLNELKGKNVVLYFYPKDHTPGCTLEGHDFTKLHKKFQAANTEVFGVSRDSLSSHEKFKEKQCYSIDLLSDSEEALCRYFGVIQPKNMYGKTVIGIERSTFLIDAEGVLRAEWRKVKVDGHAQEVLKKAMEL